MKPKLLLLLLLFIIPIVFSNYQDRCDPSCKWNFEHVNSKTIDSFPRCETVCADVILNGDSGVTEEEMEELFKNTKNLIGPIIVYGTNFKSVKFLAGLETIDTDVTYLSIDSNSQLTEISLPHLTSFTGSGINVNHNPHLKTLHLPKLVNLDISASLKEKDHAPKLTIILDNGSKDYCISIEDMERFIRIGADVNGIKEDYCKPDFDEKVCQEPREECKWVFGDVKIGTDFDMKVMTSVEAIFGRLTISGTDLEDLWFLKNLKYVVPMDKEDKNLSTITVTNNVNLTNIKMPSLKYVQGTLPNSVRFENNNEQLVGRIGLCRALNENFSFQYQKFDGRSCVEHEMRAYHEEPRRKYYVRTIMVIMIGIVTIVSICIFCIKFCRKSGYQGPASRTVEET